MHNIIVLGGGGHAKVVISILKQSKKYKILGYLDSQDRGNILGVKYFGSDNKLKSIKSRYKSCNAAIGVGSISITDIRARIYNKLKRNDFELPAIVSKHAVINEDVKIGEGTIVCDGVIVNPGTIIGNNVIVNTRSSIDHDCKIGNHVHIAPGVTLCGGVQVGENSMIGAGVTVIQYSKIGKKAFIGAGSVVCSDCKAAGVYYGIPCKKKKQ